ncbi:MAG: hypothetical protein ABWZ66_08810 [Pyrinomonadaceae bacterium]
MRFLFILFTIIAICLTLLTFGLIVLAIISGGGNVFFPGLGLVVSLPFIVVLLAIADALIILLALLFRSLSKKS